MKTFVLLLLIVSSYNVSCQIYGILYSDYEDYLQDVLKKQSAQLGDVYALDVRYSTPTLPDLIKYDALLVYSNFGFWNNVALGDLIADYVDSGKGLVVAVFSLTTFFDNIYLGGRFHGDGGNNTYYVISPGLRQSGPQLEFAPVDVDHPILSGVKTFNGGDYSLRGLGDWVSGAHPVALWTDKTPLIGTREIRGVRRVDLNFFPASSDASKGLWVPSTDGSLIISNSLKWVAQARRAEN